MSINSKSDEPSMEESGAVSREEVSPPHGGVVAFENFFALLERVTIENVNKEFVREHDVASERNEYKLILGLRFLDLIDENGNATQKLRSLHVVGEEEFVKNLQGIVREAYDRLFSRVNVEKALPKDITNSLVTEYPIARGTAREATRVFAYLCRKAKIPISEELESKGTPRKIQRKKRKEEKSAEELPATLEIVKEEMQRIAWGSDILIYLRKGDKLFREKTAKRAKALIDFYVEGPE